MIANYDSKTFRRTDTRSPIILTTQLTMKNFFDVKSDENLVVGACLLSTLFSMKLSPRRRPSFAPRADQTPVDVL